MNIYQIQISLLLTHLKKNKNKANSIFFLSTTPTPVKVFQFELAVLQLNVSKLVGPTDIFVKSAIGWVLDEAPECLWDFFQMAILNNAKTRPNHSIGGRSRGAEHPSSPQLFNSEFDESVN